MLVLAAGAGVSCFTAATGSSLFFLQDLAGVLVLEFVLELLLLLLLLLLELSEILPKLELVLDSSACFFQLGTAAAAGLTSSLGAGFFHEGVEGAGVLLGSSSTLGAGFFQDGVEVVLELEFVEELVVLP